MEKEKDLLPKGCFYSGYTLCGDCVFWDRSDSSRLEKYSEGWCGKRSTWTKGSDGCRDGKS